MVDCAHLAVLGQELVRLDEAEGLVDAPADAQVVDRHLHNTKKIGAMCFFRFAMAYERASGETWTDRGARHVMAVRQEISLLLYRPPALWNGTQDLRKRVDGQELQRKIPAPATALMEA